MNYLKEAVRKLSSLENTGNFLDVKGIIDDAILDCTGVRNLGLIELSYKETGWRLMCQTRLLNNKRRSKQISNILMSYIPKRFEKCQMYKTYIKTGKLM